MSAIAKPLKLIEPNWPAPANIVAACTTREGGVSESPFSSLNPASHVGDEEVAVARNRQRISDSLSLPEAPAWLNQTHSSKVIELDGRELLDNSADAVMTSCPDRVCVVQTADCLPVLICDQAGKQVAAVHAGWRGLAGGIIANTIGLFNAPAEQLLVWLGPAISAQHFEVGEEVRDCFIQICEGNAEAFAPSKNTGRWMADLYQLARLELQSLQLEAENIYGGDLCSYSDAQQFYSYRREGQTGRMASLIYRKP